MFGFEVFLLMICRVVKFLRGLFVELFEIRLMEILRKGVWF